MTEFIYIWVPLILLAVIAIIILRWIWGKVR